MMTPERLRELYGDPSPRAAAKEITRFDEHCRRFIRNSTFLVIATTDGHELDVSPKGDPAGFVTVEDDQHLLLPDRPGNNRIDSLMNVLVNPSVSVIFLIPAVAETLRVNGQATIIEDPDVCARFAVKGRNPKTVLRIKAHKVFAHCGKSLIRAGFWRNETWPPERPVATLNEMVRDHSGLAVESVDQSFVEAAYKRTLY
ncbi:MAG: MSMEG_1061 family FMN-dependent PPOX-type flavoprotein [Pseudomonadota bacterium]